MTPTPIRLGLVGAGGFGQRLGAAIRRSSDLALVGVVDPSDDAARVASTELEVPRLGSLAELLERTDVEGVVIATPHATHAPIALAAIAAGKHVFVEKPLTITVRDAEAVIAAAAAAGRVLLVGHVTRLLPLVEAVLERLDRGEIGDRRAAWMVRHQPLRRTGWMARREDFGMLLHSPAIHNVDLMNRVLGRPVQVTALATGPLQDGVDYPDVVAVLVGFASGAVGSLGATVSDPLFGPGGTSSGRIVGTHGGLQFDIATGSLDIQQAKGLEQIRMPVTGWGLEAAIDGELSSFAAAIRGESAPFVDPVDALLAVAVCEAADRSVATGRPIEVASLMTGGTA